MPTFVEDQSLCFLNKQLQTTCFHFSFISNESGGRTRNPCIYVSNVERKMGKIFLRRTLVHRNACLRGSGILCTETLDNHVMNLNVFPMWKQMFKERGMFTYLSITRCVHKPKHPITVPLKQV